MADKMVVLTLSFMLLLRKLYNILSKSVVIFFKKLVICLFALNMSELLLHRRENIQQAFFCLLDSMMHCMEHDSLVCI